MAGAVSPLDWFRVLSEVPTFLLQHSWSEAFDRTSALEGGPLTEHLNALDVPRPAARQPTPAELAAVFPRGRLTMALYKALFGDRLVVRAQRVAM